MKTSRKRRIAIAIAMLSLAGLSMGCGSSNSGAVGVLPGGQYGVGTCIPLNPQTAIQIPISATNVCLDSANIVGGSIPGSFYNSCGTLSAGGGYGSYTGQSVGQVVIGGAGIGAVGTSTLYQGANQNGSQISLTLGSTSQLGAYPPNYYGGTGGYMPIGAPSLVSGSGVVTISALEQQQIIASSGYGYGYNGGYGGAYPPQYPTGQYPPGQYPPTGQYPGAPGYGTSSVCVSGAAFNLGHYNNYVSRTLYLYLNNSAHGATLYF